MKWKLSKKNVKQLSLTLEKNAKTKIIRNSLIFLEYGGRIILNRIMNRSKLDWIVSFLPNVFIACHLNVKVSVHRHKVAMLYSRLKCNAQRSVNEEKKTQTTHEHLIKLAFVSSFRFNATTILMEQMGWCINSFPFMTKQNGIEQNPQYRITGPHYTFHSFYSTVVVRSSQMNNTAFSIWCWHSVSNRQ